MDIYGYIYMGDYHNEWTNELGFTSINVECPRTCVLSASPCICQSLLWLAHGASTNVASYFAHGASSRLPFHCLFRMVVRGDVEDPMHRGAGGKGWPRRKGEEQIVRGDFISFICVYIMYIYNITIYRVINIYIVIYIYIHLINIYITNIYIINMYIYTHKIWWTIQPSGHVNFPSNPAFELMV